MAIVEINLEKPALVEEYQFPDETSGRTSGTSQSSGGKAGKLVGLLVVLAGLGAAVWKLKQSGDDQSEFGEQTEFETEASGVGGKAAGAAGFAVTLVVLALAVRKRRK